MKKVDNNNYSFLNRNYENLSKTNIVGEIRSFGQKWKLTIPLILAFVCYCNGLYGDFVHDDVFAIKRNPDVHGKTDISEIFRNDFWGKPMHENKSHKSYRPITVLTFRLNNALSGPQPFSYHLVNILLHMIVTSLFMYTCRVILKVHETGVLTAGTLFALHPVHTEAVTGLVGRADVLAATLFLLSFISYARCVSGKCKKTLYFLCSLSLGAAAMLSKETGITVFGVCLAFDLLTILRNRKFELTDKWFVGRVITTSLFTIALFWFRVRMMAGTLPKFTPADNPASFCNSTTTRLCTYGYIWSLNVWLLIAPTTLCYDWQHGSIPLVESVLELRNLATVVTATVLMAIITSAVRDLRWGTDNRGTQLCMGLVLLVVPFLPASNLFFPVGFVLAERVLYIPSMGSCLLISIAFTEVIARHRQNSTAIVAAILLLCVMFAGKTLRQNTVWMTRKSLFRSGVNALPHNAKVHYNYGNFLKDNKTFEAAIAHYRTALRLDASYASAHNNLGTLLEDRYEAEVHFREAHRLYPEHQGALINLGNLLFKRGEQDEGVKYLFRAVELEPRNPEATTSLASCLIELGNFTDAEKYLKDTLQTSPDYKEAYKHYGALLSQNGRHRESATIYKRAYDLDRAESITLVQAAQQYRSLGDITEAEKLFKRALDIRRDANTLEQLAVLYYTTGRTKDSIALYADIERLGHNSTDTVIRHAKIVAADGDLAKAESILDRTLVQNSQDVGVIALMAQVKGKLGKHQQAVELLNRGIQLTLGTEGASLLEEMYFDRADNHRDSQNYAKALADYTEVLRINPRHSRAHGNCGAIYHMNGSVDKARYHYRQALELDPSDKITKRNLEKVDRLQRHRTTDVG